MPSLGISPRQFGLVVSAYAFSAGLSGLLAAGFADRFDRKKILLFFYCGFILGTLLCGLVTNYNLLLGARIVTGLFGGVIGSVVLAIATDLFPLEMRGRVMGFIQTAFAASQVLGIPLGLYLSNLWGWHAPFLMIVGIGFIAGFIIVFRMKPVDGHLTLTQEHSAAKHLFHTISEKKYLLAFLTTGLLTTGGFMLMPFSSAFTVHNLGISLDKLPTIYLVSGLFTIFTGPLIGKASDRYGKFQTFVFGSGLAMIMVFIYTHRGLTPLPLVIGINVLMFVAIFSRMIPSQALMTSIPETTQRGSFNSLSASIQQISGGIASVVAGLIVTQLPDGTLSHFEVLGYVVIGSSIVTLFLMYQIHRSIPEKTSQSVV